MFANATFGFFSGDAGVVNLAGFAIEAFYDVSSAVAGLRINSDGSIERNRNGWATVSPWYVPLQGGIGASYWVRATLLSGTTPDNSAVGTWLALSAARTWTHTTTPNAVQTATLLIEISTTNSAAGIVTDGTYSFTADSNLL